MHPLLATVRGVGRCRRGAMSVETALVFAFMLFPLLLGIWEGSRLVVARSALGDAVTAAITLTAHRSPERPTTAELQQAARQAVGDAALTLATADVCICADAAGDSIVVRACGGSCAAGLVPSRFLRLEVARDVTTRFPISLVQETVSLRSTATVRTP